MASWSDKEVLKLIEIWGEQTIQEQLEGCKRNREVFDKISREMAVAGFTRTGPQCREKVKKLKGEYKKIKDGLKQTGNNRKTCKFFEELDEVMGTKPAIAPPVLLDTFSTPTTESSDHEEAYQRNDEESLNNSLTSGGSVDGDGKAEEKQSSEVNDKDEAAEKRVEKKPVSKKRSRDEKLEKTLDTFMKGMTKALSSSDERFINLEEKRIKLDEMMLKMENDRIKENEAREERRRREDREFQLKMFTLLHSNNATPTQQPMMPSQYYYNSSSSSASSTSGIDPMYEWPGNCDN